MIKYLKKTFRLTSHSSLSLSFIILISLIISMSEIISLGIFQSILLSMFDSNLEIDNRFLNDIKKFFYTNFQASPLKIMLLFFVIFYSLKNLTTIFLNFFFFKFIEKQHFLLNKKFFKILIKTKYLDLSKNKNTFYNQILSRYIENFIKSVFGSIIKITTETLFVFIIFMYLLSINFKLVLLTIVVLTSLILIYNSTIKKFLKQNSENVSKTEETIKFNIYEYIKNYREIFLYNLKNNFLDKLNISSRLFVKYERKFLFLGSITKYVFEIILITFLCFYMLSFIEEGKITYELSSLITMSFALLKLMPSFNMINHSLIQINQHSYSVKILEDFISNSEEDDDELKIAASERFDHKINKIEVKNLSFSYDSNKQIIKNFNFECKKGDLILIKGDSGVGKSTLLDLLSSVIDAKHGAINFYDENNNLIENFNDFAYVGQQPNLFNETLKYNLKLNKNKISDDKLIKIVQKVDLNLDCEFEKMLEFNIQEDGKNLSGGQKQKLSIARAIIQDKTVLLFDEITSGLDLNSEKKIIDLINELKRNKIVFFISHKTNIIADKIINLEK